MRRYIAFLIAPALLAGCGSDDEPGSSETNKGDSDQPRTQAGVRDTTQEQLDRFSSSDFGGAWDMWTKEGQDAVAREDYVAYAEACAMAGMPLEIDDVRLESDNEAIARISVSQFKQSYTLLYQDGQWRWQPLDATITALEDGDMKAATKDC